MNSSRTFRRLCAVWLFAAAFAIPASPARAAVGVWTPLGPDGASVYALAVHPANPRILYAGTDVAGVFKSVDGGATWKPSSAGLAPPGQGVWIRALVIDPRNPETVYAATLQNGVYRSEDGGRSWVPASGGLPRTGSTVEPVFSLALDPRSPRTLYAGMAGGVYRSADGGATWRRRSAGLPASGAVRALAVDPASGVVYAGRDFGGLFRSADQGRSWTAWGSGIPEHDGIASLAIDPLNPRRLLAGTTQGIFRSADSGRTWRRVGRAVVQGYVPAVLFQGADRAYAGTLENGVYRSVDGGATWRPAEEGPSDPRILSLASGRGRVYAGTFGKTRPGGVYRSGDGGATWEPGLRGLSALAVQEIAVDPSDPDVLYASAGPVGLFKSTDRGGSWSLLDLGLPPDVDVDINSLVIDPARPSTLYAASRINGPLLRSEDGGETWQLFTDVFVVLYDLALDPGDPGALWGAGVGLYRSEDGGATWTRQPLQPEEAFAFFDVEVDPRDPRVLYVAGAAIQNYRPLEYRPRILRSADGGQTWERRDAGTAGNTAVLDLEPDPAEPSTLYAMTGRGLYRSTDAGASWTLLPLEGSFTALAVAPSSPPALYVAQQGRGVLRSTDRGETWTPIRRGLGVRHVLRLVVDPHDPETIFAGTLNGGIFTYTVPSGD